MEAASQNEASREITDLVQVTEGDQGAVAHVFTAQQMIDQVEHIQTIMRGVMKEGEHYGVIPGTSKPSLYKPGAEKICMTFRLRPEYTIEERDLPNGHREYEIICDLYDIITGNKIGSGVGFCSTMESKYRYRKEERVCPVCGAAAIIKGKEEYGGGWVCWRKKDGCDAKFLDGDPAIEGQVVGRVENPDIADTYNTVLKMSKKRAHVDATLTATAASDIFTQDTEDMAQFNGKKADSNPRNSKPSGASRQKPNPSQPAENPPPEKTTTDNFEFLKAMRELKEGFIKQLGAEGGAFEYYAVIHEYNAERSNQLVNEADQKAAYRKLRARLDLLTKNASQVKKKPVTAGDNDEGDDIWIYKPIRAALGEFAKEALEKSLTDYYNEYAYPIGTDPKGIKAMLAAKRATKGALIEAHVLILKWNKEQGVK